MKRKKKKNTIEYSKFIIGFSLLLFVVIIFRVSELALAKRIDGIDLQELASKRTTKTKILPAKRGNIYSEDGEILAQNVSSYKLIAYLDSKRTTNENDPQHVVDKQRTAKELAPILGTDEKFILNNLNKTGVYQTEFGSKGKGLTELDKSKIENLNLPGLDFVESYKRYYPKGQFASYTIGYAKGSSEDENNIKGEMGIEKQYDSILKGTDGYIKYQKDLKGYQIAGTPVITEKAKQGKEIHLTLNSNIQFFMEKAINNAASKYNFEWFNMTIADAKTGAILGTANSPSFDPNKRNIKNYLDTLVSIPYEPGSTMKTYTYMAAMENDVYDGNETYLSGVYTTTDGTQIGDWNRHGWGTITFDRGYAMSSNVAIINIIDRHMNSLMLRQYFKKLGFGKPTGISLPNEVSGKIDFKYETEIFNAGFGQGVTTTPIQNIQALTPLTNDGILLKPYIVSKIVDSDTGEIILENKRKEKDRVASTQTVEKMRILMDDAINGVGVAGAIFKTPNGELIGKTGTAQIADENGRGYLKGKSDIISSFAGIYPKSDPKIIIYASVKRPENGSQRPLSNAIKEVVDNISKYYGDNPNENKIEVKNYKVENFINKKIDNAKIQLNKEQIPFQIIGNGDKIIKQVPSQNLTITNKDTVFLITNDSDMTVPNVLNLSSKLAKNILEELGVKVKLEGVGYVTEQSIAPGTKIQPNNEIVLNLKTKF